MSRLIAKALEVILFSYIFKERNMLDLNYWILYCHGIFAMQLLG